MRTVSPSSDYLRRSPFQSLCAICFPLLLINIISLFTTTLTNQLYSNHAGQAYFAVSGYLSSAVTFFGNIVGGVYTAAWIKIAHQHALHSKDVFSRAMGNALFAMLLALAISVPLFLIFMRPVLRVLSVPDQYLSDAKLYYILYFSAYLPVALAAVMLTIVNGISNSRRIFWVNVFVIAGNLAAAVLLLVVFRLGFTGALLCGAGGAVIHLVFYWILFRHDGYFRGAERFRPDWTTVGAILRYSVPIILQNFLCTAGYLCVSFQTNRLLSPEYITVLSVDLPLNGMLSAFSSAILAFCPPNFAAGRTDRLKHFMRIMFPCALVYSGLCVLIYGTLAPWYYGRLFEDAQIVAYGCEYWFWRGLGFLPLAVIFTVRYFFNAVGLNQFSMLSGIGEFVGNALCAFWVIPCYGNIGRSLSFPLGWALGAVTLLAAYIINRKKIFPVSR